MRFEWNPDKAKTNEQKHDGVTFKEAAEVFLDENAFEDYDDEHSNADEKRFVRIGNSSKHLLRVSFTVRQDEADDEIIRIISAKKGKAKEVKKYNEQNK
jgi:uncharacterized DUF497 family protein